VVGAVAISLQLLIVCALLFMREGMCPHTSKALITLDIKLKRFNITTNPRKDICNLKNSLVYELSTQSLERAMKSLKDMLFFS
jgi:hypothetical protein